MGILELNNLVLLCLLIFIVIRAIGLGISVDFYYDTKQEKFILLGIAWALWILAALMPIYSNLVKDTGLVEFLLLLNVLFFLLGGIFCIWGLGKYFLSVPAKLMGSLIIISIALPFLVLLTIGYFAAMVFSAIFVYGLLITTYIIPPLKKQNFKKYIGKSIRWYYVTIFIILIYIPISMIIYFQGYSYGLYDTDDTILIILSYIPALGASILLIILLVHLEYTISNREIFDLKDKYSHELGNIMQAIYTTLDLIKSRREPKTELSELEILLENKIIEASNLIKEIRKL